MKVTYTIKVTGIFPCARQSYFYNSAGRVSKEKLKSILGPEMTKVVAWYKCKSFGDYKLTMCDKIVHKQLANIFQTVPELFSVCLSTSENSDLRGTLSFAQRFIRYHHCDFKELFIRTPNLSDPKDTFREAAPSGEDDTFKKLMRSAKKKNEVCSGLDYSIKIETTLQQHITLSVKKLFNSEAKLFVLNEEVVKLLNARTLGIRAKTENVPNENGIVATETVTSSPCKTRNMRGRAAKQKGEKRKL